MKRTILIVEDMASLAMTYSAILESEGYATIIMDNGESALELLRTGKQKIHAILLDLQLPGIGGLALLQSYPELMQPIPVVVATADGSIARAIEAMRHGAYDFLVKPLSAARLASVMKSAIDSMQTITPLRPPHEAKNDDAIFEGFVGTSPAMKAVYQRIKNVARSKATIFIMGESGTGKEICAEAIHRQSPRKLRPFVPINCGAIPNDLMESVLFGHVKGSFTGAITDQMGAAQAAHGGTLFLDEICEMDISLQVKLLRFLQAGTVQRVGSTKQENVDIRIICATNRDPQTEVKAGRFREDLYYRLAVIPMILPPLRDRENDIVIIADHFLQKFAREEAKTFAPLSTTLQHVLMAHDWPGNVRELQNQIRRASVLYDDPHLPDDAFSFASSSKWETENSIPKKPMIARTDSQSGAKEIGKNLSDFIHSISGLSLENIERIAINNAIDQSGGSLPIAARRLGISPSTLYRKKEKWAPVD